MGFVFFAITSLYVISILWVPYYTVCNLFLDAGWEYPIREFEYFLIAVVFCLAVFLCVTAKKIFPLRAPAVVIGNVARYAILPGGKVYVFCGALLGASALLALISSKGIALSVGNYGSRFESNAGTGILTIVSYVIVSISVVRVVSRKTHWAAFFALLISVAYGVTLFFTLSGERNYLVAAVAPILLVSYVLRVIDGKHLILFVLLGVAGVTGLALIRYGNQFTSGSWLLVATYTRDTIFPVESLSAIFYRDNLKFVGFDYFFEQFYSVIPRFIWPSKPIYLDTIAYYFTERIYAYGRGLIIAPTGVGSLYLMGGWVYVLIGVLAAVAVFFVCDYFVFNGGVVFFVCLWPTLFFSFFSFRESVELGLFKILVHSLGTAGIYSLAKGVNALLPKRRMRTPDF